MRKEELTYFPTMCLELFLLLLSHFVTDSQSVLALIPSGAHDQILAVVRQLRDDIMGRLL